MLAHLTILFLAIFVKPIHSSLAVFPVKIGENLILDIGREVKQWNRIRKSGEETIQICSSDNLNNTTCNIWMNSELKPVGDGREHIFENGTLLIENFREDDSGDYFSNDELERVRYSADGHIWKLARTKISVIAI